MKQTCTALLISATALFTSCNNNSAFKPTESPNPWSDSYINISSMENYKSWGTYNVHDPACKKFGDYYYMYSTDAIHGENREEASKHNVPLGNIQIRRSTDLINWEFVGWAFDDIPSEASAWVRGLNNGRGAENIWAPYVIEANGVYRLYYCVSAFGKKTSYIGLAESDNPEGPWLQKGCVVKTDYSSPVNAIDPSIIVNPHSGEWWMHYGSYFGGLYAVKLNAETGLTYEDNDLGIVTARRANYRKDNLEAPEIIYNEDNNMFYLFYSYDPLMTTYNVRVGRSENIDGPFLDFYGNEVRDTTNNFPILTAPYRFNNHPGWAGTAHCGLLKDDDDKYFMVHQGRLSPDNHQMVLHTREVFFTESGWPVVSPQRYTGSDKKEFRDCDIAGKWEIIRITEPAYERELEAGPL